MKKILKILIILIILIVIIEIGYNMIINKLYVTKYSEYVYKYAEEYNIDPLLILAIIKAESNFRVDAKSSANAHGLMQLMEPTAGEVCGELNIEYSLEVLYNPEININLGIKYFANLLKIYDGNTNIAIIAYNAGISNVNRWISEGTIQSDGSDIENVPFKETNNYIRKILRDYKIYKILYKK